MLPVSQTPSQPSSQPSQQQLTGNKEKKNKRNVWTSEEVQFFLTLVKEKQIMGLMDGKRLRTSDIFKTLVGPMKARGYVRDGPQLIIKYKNLKAEYYKCKRHNAISGNSPMLFEYYDEMDDILGNRPISQSCDTETGFEVIENIPVLEDTPTMKELFTDVEVIYEDQPDFDGAIPGTSKSSEPYTDVPSSSNKASAKVKAAKKRKADPLAVIENELKEMKDKQNSEIAADKEFLNALLDKQESVMIRCTEYFLTGLKSLMTPKGNSSNNTSNNTIAEDESGAESSE